MLKSAPAGWLSLIEEPMANQQRPCPQGPARLANDVTGGLMACVRAPSPCSLLFAFSFIAVDWQKGFYPGAGSDHCAGRQSGWISHSGWEIFAHRLW